MAEILIYDVIGRGFLDDGVTAEGIREELNDIPEEEDILVRINSPGGDVFEAAAIQSLLSQRSYNTRIDGIAASAASYIGIGGDSVSMFEGGMLMIHDPWTMTVGDSSEHGRQMKLLDKVADTIAKTYQRKTGGELKVIRDAMRDETWMTAEEAVEFGLVDSIAEGSAVDYTVPDVFGYKNAPKTERKPQKHTLSSEAMKRRIAAARHRFSVLTSVK